MVGFTCAIFGCSQGQSNHLYEQYTLLLQQSQDFSAVHPTFLEMVTQYIANQKDYRFSDGRMEYMVCQPFLLSSQKDKVLVMVLKRSLDLNDRRTEYVRFISAQKTDKTWKLALDTVGTRSFSYAYEENPTLSDQEITLRILRNLIDEGYMGKKDLKINDQFFQTSDWYVLK